MSCREKVRVSRNWCMGLFWETCLLEQNLRYMPRLQLEDQGQESILWVSCLPQLGGGHNHFLKQ